MPAPAHLRSAVAVPLVLLAAGCAGAECLALPCALPVAIELTLTDAGTGGGISGATVGVSGPEESTLPCDSSCTIPGVAGTYTLDITAPGYPATRKTVEVKGTTPACGCASAQTENLTVTLTPVP